MHIKDIKVVNDEHFVKVPRSRRVQSIKSILVAMSDGALNPDCDRMKSNGYAKLIELRDQAMAKLEMEAELAKLPAWQADHAGKAMAVKKPKGNRSMLLKNLGFSSWVLNWWHWMIM